MVRTQGFEFEGDQAAAFASLERQLAPVSEGVVDRLDVPAPGARVVDLACGSGEPGLTLLARYPDTYLLEVDRSADMLAIARRRADGSGRVRFLELDIEDLDLPPGSADVVVSRFGFLAMEDTARSAAGFARLAAPGCAFSIATWDRLAANPPAHLGLEALRGFGGEVLAAPLEDLDARSAAGHAEAALRDVGVAELTTDRFTWSTRIDRFDTLWSFFAGPGFAGSILAGLDADAVEQVRRRYAFALHRYRQPDGSYDIPRTCRFHWGRV